MGAWSRGSFGMSNMAEPRRANSGGYGGRDRGPGGPGDRDRAKYGRSGRGKPRERPRSGGRGKPDYLGGASMEMKQPPVILAREKRAEPVMPGMISIIRREPSGSHLPSSPHKGPPSGIMATPTSPLSTSPHYPQPQPLPPTIKSRYDKDDLKGRPLRKTDGVSSNPSSYTPLQPSSRGPRDRDGGLMISRSDHTAFMNSATEMSHSVKLVDKNWQFEDRGIDSMLDQSDFLVVGALGKQAVGKSTVMSLLAGTRTGSGKPAMFRTQSKEVHTSGTYQTTGIDMAVTGERIILLDTQPILSDTMLEQFVQNEGLVPSGMRPESYLEVLSLQLAIFLYTVCHVVVIVMDTMDSADVIFRFLWTVERLKPLCVKVPMDVPPELGERQARDHLPQLVFVFNHASPDDFQPMSLRELHCLIAESFHGSKVILAGGVSLAKSGLVPIGRGFPAKKPSKNHDEVAAGEVNMFLLPSIQSSSDNYGSHCTNRPEKQDVGLNPVFSLLPSYTGHPSFQLLSETFRNRVFSMPRPPLRPTTQQQLTEREWFEYARRIWMMVKKSDLISEYDRILQSTSPT